ncbi:MAG: hypothetical protein OEY85_13870, partial [Rhodospirillales bacterium]|nr:hypothetical protein [Rhodospirillales bacterium]
MVDESELLSSNQLIELTGITRTSLNNFIALGILPKPTFPQRDKANQPRMGYYPTSTVNTIKHVLDLEAQGKSLADIIQFLSRERNLAIAGFIDTGQGLDDTLQEPPYTPPPSDDRRKS